MKKKPIICPEGVEDLKLFVVVLLFVSSNSDHRSQSDHTFENVLAIDSFLFFSSMLVEFSSADVHVEDSAGPELWKHCGHQACRADPPHGPTHWIAHQRGIISGSACKLGLIQAVG